MAQVIQKRPQQVHGRVNSDTLLSFDASKQQYVDCGVNLNVAQAITNKKDWSISFLANNLVKISNGNKYPLLYQGNLSGTSDRWSIILQYNSTLAGHTRIGVYFWYDDASLGGDNNLISYFFMVPTVILQALNYYEINYDQATQAPSLSINTRVFAIHDVFRYNYTQSTAPEIYAYEKLYINEGVVLSKGKLSPNINHIVALNRRRTADETAYCHRYSGIIPESTHAGCVAHYVADRQGRTMWDVVEQYNYAKTTALTAQHATMQNYTDSEVGLPNESSQTAYKDFYSKQTASLFGLSKLFYKEIDRDIIVSEQPISTIGTDILTANHDFTFYFKNVLSSPAFTRVGEQLISFETRGGREISIPNHTAIRYRINNSFYDLSIPSIFDYVGVGNEYEVLVIYTGVNNTARIAFKSGKRTDYFVGELSVNTYLSMQSSRVDCRLSTVHARKRTILCNHAISIEQERDILIKGDFSALNASFLDVNWATITNNRIVTPTFSFRLQDFFNNLTVPENYSDNLLVEQKSLLPPLQNALKFEAGKTGSGGNLGTLQGIAFAVKLNTANQNLFQLAATTATQIGIQSNTFQVGAAITGITVWVDGIAQTLAKAGQILNDLKLHHVTVQFTAITATNFQILSFDGFLASLIYLKEKLTRKEGIELTNNTLLSRPKKAVQAKAEGIINFNRIIDTSGVYTLEDLSGKNRSVTLSGYNAANLDPADPAYCFTKINDLR